MPERRIATVVMLDVVGSALGTMKVTELPLGAEIRALVFDGETDTFWVDVA
jgi:hypothetical protein